LLQQGPVDPKFQVEGVAPTNHSLSSQKIGLNDLSYGIKIWTDLSSVLSQCTRLTDGQTDGVVNSDSMPLQRTRMTTMRIYYNPFARLSLNQYQKRFVGYEKHDHHSSS